MSIKVLAEDVLSYVQDALCPRDGEGLNSPATIANFWSMVANIRMALANKPQFEPDEISASLALLGAVKAVDGWNWLGFVEDETLPTWEELKPNILVHKDVVGLMERLVKLSPETATRLALVSLFISTQPEFPK